MLGLILALALSQTPQQRLRMQPNLPRGSTVAHFMEAAGAGVQECDGTMPSPGGIGPITFGRASQATCCRADGGCSTLSNNQPIVSTCPGCAQGQPLGVTSESTVSTNQAIRCVEGDNAAWVVVGTGTKSGTNTYDGPFAAAELEQITCAAAGDGVQQTVPLTALNQKAFSVWLRSGSASALTLSIVGTGNAAGDRSRNVTVTAQPTRYAVVGTAAYAAGLTAVTIKITCNGVTGTFGYGHAQLEEDSGAFSTFFTVTSHIHTTAVAVTRAANTWQFPTPSFLSDSVGCVATSTKSMRWDAETPTAYILLNWSGATRYATRPYTLVTNGIGFDSTNSAQVNGGSDVSAGIVKYVYEWSGTTATARQGAASASVAYDGTILAATTDFGTSQMTAWMTDFVLSNNLAACR